jgi:hypothetical protein
MLCNFDEPVVASNRQLVLGFDRSVASGKAGAG